MDLPFDSCLATHSSSECQSPPSRNKDSEISVLSKSIMKPKGDYFRMLFSLCFVIVIFQQKWAATEILRQTLSNVHIGGKQIVCPQDAPFLLRLPIP